MKGFHMWQWILTNLIRSEQTNAYYAQLENKKVRYFR